MFESHILYIYLINIFVCPFPFMKVTDRLAIYCIFHVSRILILEWCRNESRISCQFETNYVKINMADGVKRVKRVKRFPISECIVFAVFRVFTEDHNNLK